MTVVMPDIDITNLFDDVGLCDNVFKDGSKCTNKAEWICFAQPCGCPRFFCTPCKEIVKRVVDNGTKVFRDKRYYCQQCDGRVFGAKWEQM